MNISSIQTYTSLYEPREHTAGCQCPGCCKDKVTTPTNKNEINTIKNPNAPSTEALDNNNEQKGDTVDSSELTQAERQQVIQLQQRDSEVRSHEAAHMAAGGSVVSGAASFTYQKGPDGRLYAVGGEVAISSSGGNTPEEKIAIARQLQAGALAPANPSPQDLKVASSAAMMETQARRELSLEKSEEQKQKEVGSYIKNQSETTQEQARSIQLEA